MVYSWFEERTTCCNKQKEIKQTLDAEKKVDTKGSSLGQIYYNKDYTDIIEALVHGLIF